MNNKKIPEGTISRLFIYLRVISEFANMNIRTISSSELGERLSLSDAQGRNDLGYFGNFGVTGTGYDTFDLKKTLEKILGKDKTWNVAVLGVGHLGAALLAYAGFKNLGLEIVAAFDTNPKIIGQTIEDTKVYSIDDLTKIVSSKNISIGIITVSSGAAQGAADLLVRAGVECIMNFAPVSLNVPDEVKVKNMDLSRELETLSYFLVNKK
jgi:redox-sensing transcriptional repressor